jgi:hypothetical protein
MACTLEAARVVQWLERRFNDQMILTSRVRITLWDMGGLSIGWDYKIRGPVSKQFWHVKESSLLKAKLSICMGRNLQLGHWEWWQPSDSWKIARAAINSQTNKQSMCPCKEGVKIGSGTLSDWLFTVLRPSKEFFTYIETSTGEGLLTVGLCSALMAYRARLWAGRGLYRVKPAIDKTWAISFSCPSISSERPSAGPPFQKFLDPLMRWSLLYCTWSFVGCDCLCCPTLDSVYEFLRRIIITFRLFIIPPQRS